MKEKCLNILLFLFVMTLCTLILEIALRMKGFPVHGEGSNRVHHEVLVFVGDPKTEGVDARGFRNESVLENAGIVALGDSHTYGYNVLSENSWPQQLGKMTGETVYNFGTGAYGMLHYNYLIDEAIKLQPKYIFLGLYLPNDLIDIYRAIHLDHWKEWVRENNLKAPEYAPEKSGLKRGFVLSVEALTRKSALVSFLNLTYQLHLQPQVEKDNYFSIHEKQNEKHIKLSRLKHHEEQMDLESREIQAAYLSAQSILKEMKSKTDANNIEFIVLIIPSMQNALYNYAMEKGATLPEIYHKAVGSERALAGKMTQFLNQSGIAFVDVLPYMANLVNREGHVYPVHDDGHPLESGYRAYAQAAFDRMSKGSSLDI